MKIIRISAIWCSSCIIMKSRFNSIISNKDIELVDLDYDFDDIEKYDVGTILPVYIKLVDDKEVKRLVGEHSKEELESFLGD